MAEALSSVVDLETRGTRLTGLREMRSGKGGGFGEHSLRCVVVSLSVVSWSPDHDTLKECLDLAQEHVVA